MRVGLVIVQHHHPSMSRELGLRELARRAFHRLRIRAVRHRQHDIESLTSRADLVDERAAVAPLIDQVMQDVLALVLDAPVASALPELDELSEPVVEAPDVEAASCPWT